MGGRGGASGKGAATGGGGSSGATGGSSSNGVGGSGTSSKAKMSGSSAASNGVGVKVKPFTPSKTPVSKMSDKKLRSELAKAAGHYYASGKSGISFGGRDPYQAAETLANQKMSRSRMEKEYKSILRKLK